MLLLAEHLGAPSTKGVRFRTASDTCSSKGTEPASNTLTPRNCRATLAMRSWTTRPSPGARVWFTSRLNRLGSQILWRVPDHLMHWFEYLNEHRRPFMNDQVQAKQLFENGKRLIAEQSWDELKQVIFRLWDLVPADDRGTDEETRVFTGIV